MASASPKDEKTLEKTGKIWQMLDDMQNKNPKQYKQFMDKMLKEGKEEYGVPAARFAFYTTKTPKTIPVQEYHINVVEWKNIPESNKDGPPGAIPILNSKPRKETIKGKVVNIIDVGLNPATMDRYLNSAQPGCNRELLVECLLQYVEGQLNIILSRKYQLHDKKENYIGNRDNIMNFMMPPDVKEAMGNVTGANDPPVQGSFKSGDSSLQKPAEQKRQQGPLITATGLVAQEGLIKEVKTKKLCPAKASVPQKKQTLPKPRFEMTIDKEDDSVTWDIQLRGVHSVAECDMILSETNLYLDVTDKYKLDLDLPFLVDENRTEAKFLKQEQRLTVTSKLKR